MPEFVYGGLTLPPTKHDAYPLPFGADGTIYVSASDLNLITQALTDLRTAMLAGPYHGLTVQTVTPATPPSGQVRLFVRSSDSALCVLLSSGTVVPLGSGGGGGTSSRTFASDSSDVLHYTFDESAIPYANTGSGGTANLGLTGGSVNSRAGLFVNGTSIGRGAAFRGVAQDRIQGGASIEPAFPITLSLWWQHVSSNGCTVFGKLYRPDGTFADPFVSTAIGIANANGDVQFQITSGAVLSTIGVSTSYDRLVVGAWNLAVGTYDGTTMKLYVNGNLVVTGAKTGAIDYGTHGPWTTEQSPPGTGLISGVLDEVRVANVVRDQTWVESYWKTGMLIG